MEEAAIRLQVERARAGEGEALGALFEALRPDVLRLCRRLLGPIEAEDAVNEVFQRVQTRLEGYDATQPFRKWLLAVAAHHCIDRLRRRSVEKRLFEPESEVQDLPGSAPSALDALVRAQRQTAVQDALARLPDRYRAPLVLRYFADLDFAEIAEILAVSRNQVATLLFRGRQRLREAFAEERP